MGNRSSTLPSSAPVRETPISEPEEEEGSSIILDQELQSTLVKNFQSKILKEEWEGRQRELMLQSNEREAIAEKNRIDLEQKKQQWREKNDAKHRSLDAQMDQLKNSYRDTEFALKYDLKALENKMGAGPKYHKEDNTCLDARVNMSKCFKSNNDITACDELTNIFEQCVKKVIVQKA